MHHSSEYAFLPAAQHASIYQLFAAQNFGRVGAYMNLPQVRYSEELQATRTVDVPATSEERSAERASSAQV